MRQMYEYFADVLEYPASGLAEAVEKCMAALAPDCLQAPNLLRQFQEFFKDRPAGEVEELYTSTFELQSNCCLYAGHYIFGEDFRRSLLMVKLKEYFREIGFSAGKELPDHLCILLRFLARAGDSREAHDVLIECLVPAAGAILNQLPKSNPYHPVLESLLLVLKARWEEIVKRSEAPPHERQEGAAENQQQPSAAEGES